MRGRWLMVMLVCFQQGTAQTWEEWFQQKTTKIKYLNQQIAANRSFSEMLSKGYQIVAGGLELAQSIRQGEFNLHNGFFESLKSLNPKLSGYARIADIIALSVAGFSEIRSITVLVGVGDEYSKVERDFLKGIAPKIYEEILGDIDLLRELISDSRLSISDEGRMRKIDELYLRGLETIKSLKSLKNDLVLLAVNRRNEKAEIDYSKILNQSR